MKYISVEILSRPTTSNIITCGTASRLSHRNKTINTVEEHVYLLKTLILLGDDHAKAVRGLHVYYLLSAPRFFWQEFVTYRLGSEQLGSESTMHSAPKFKTEDEFLEWKNNITEGTMQSRIFDSNYQALRRIYFARRNHRLPHWKEFCSWIETLPYAKELITCQKES